MTAPAPDDHPILTELAELRATIDAADDARARRLELWVEARKEGAFTNTRLAKASDVSEPYVTRLVNEALSAERKANGGLRKVPRQPA